MNTNIQLLSSLNPVNAFAAHCISHPNNNYKEYAVELQLLRLATHAAFCKRSLNTKHLVYKRSNIY
jgi:hypothetical protein